MKLFALFLYFTLWCSTIEAAPAKPNKTVHEYKVNSSSSHQEALKLKFEENYSWTNDAFWDEIFLNKNCFILTKSPNAPELWMSVDFGFDQQDRRRLFATPEHEMHFCLSDYIYLNRMNEYHLYLNTGGPFDEKEVSVKLVQVEGKNSYVQEPGKASFGAGWLYYSSVFDYSFEKPVDGHDDKFYACDVILNCFAFESKVLDGNKTVLYSLPVETRNKLRDTTPFVQILGENNKRYDSSKYKLHYNNAIQQSLAKLKSLHPESKSEPKNAISHIQKVTHQSDKIHVKIPVSIIDLRLQEVVASVSILSGHNSSLRLIGLRSVPGGFSWSVPDGINYDMAQLNLSTHMFYTLRLEEHADEQLLSQNLELDYQVRFDPQLGPSPQLDVKIEYKVDSLDKVLGHPNARSMLGGLAQFPKESIFDNTEPNPIRNSNLNSFTWTSWTYDRSDLRMIKSNHDLYTTVNFIYNVSEPGLEDLETLTPKNLQITRVILGSRGKHFKVTPLDLHFFNSTHAVFHDPIHFTDFPKEEEYFKLGYLTRIEGADLDDQIEFHFHAHEFDHAQVCAFACLNPKLMIFHVELQEGATPLPSSTVTRNYTSVQLTSLLTQIKEFANWSTSQFRFEL